MINIQKQFSLTQWSLIKLNYIINKQSTTVNSCISRTVVFLNAYIHMLQKRLCINKFNISNLQFFFISLFSCSAFKVQREEKLLCEMKIKIKMFQWLHGVEFACYHYDSLSLIVIHTADGEIREEGNVSNIKTYLEKVVQKIWNIKF